MARYNNSCNVILIPLRIFFPLQDLDLRLNPVTKNEPDYRLFIVHMLPNLRRLGAYSYVCQTLSLRVPSSKTNVKPRLFLDVAFLSYLSVTSGNQTFFDNPLID